MDGWEVSADPATDVLVTQIAVAVVSFDGQYLIGLRPAGAPLAGLWEFPGGKLHPGETPAEAAVRECLEETNLPVAAVGEYKSVEHQYVHGRLKIHFLKCLLINPAPGREPAPRFRWVRRESLDQYAFPPANAELIESLKSE
jgi:mutator protein MutT